MTYLDYYKYQAKARGILELEDVQRDSRAKSYLYDRIVQPWLPLDRNKRIIELACGHGAFLNWVKEKGFTNIGGVDSSPEQIEFARKIVETVVLDDVNSWMEKQNAGEIDALVAIDLIEHLSKDDFMEFLLLSERVLAPGGHLILRCPNGDSPVAGRNIFNDITHVWAYTPNALQSLSAMHGFASARFCDESHAAIRDHRWIKVPLARLSAAVLGMIVRGATREKIRYWSPHLWVCLQK